MPAAWPKDAGSRRAAAKGSTARPSGWLESRRAIAAPRASSRTMGLGSATNSSTTGTSADDPAPASACSAAAVGMVPRRMAETMADASARIFRSPSTHAALVAACVDGEPEMSAWSGATAAAPAATSASRTAVLSRDSAESSPVPKALTRTRTASTEAILPSAASPARRSDGVRSLANGAMASTASAALMFPSAVRASRRTSLFWSRSTSTRAGRRPRIAEITQRACHRFANIG